MSTVKIYKTQRKMLYDYEEYGETVDDTINRLLDEADLPEPTPDTVTNLNVSKDTLDRLKSFKMDGETLQDVIVRALNVVNNGGKL